MKEINIKLAKNIAEILTEFDFESTVKTFKVLEIEWERDGEKRNPNINDVRKMANDLMWNAIEYAYENVTNYAFSESGCFRAEYHCDDETKEEWVDLIFEPCTWRKEC